jgi:hypothetical protein
VKNAAQKTQVPRIPKGTQKIRTRLRLPLSGPNQWILRRDPLAQSVIIDFTPGSASMSSFLTSYSAERRMLSGLGKSEQFHIICHLGQKSNSMSCFKLPIGLRQRADLLPLASREPEADYKISVSL